MKFKNVKLFGSGGAQGALFYAIGNYAKARAASTEVLNIAKRFGSGNGHCMLFIWKERDAR